jgi:hypothetical protein
MTDDEFLARLAAHLGHAPGGVEPETPVFKNTDGSINREKTLSLPCYWNLRISESR